MSLPVIVFGIYLLVIVFDFIPLIRSCKKKREIWMYSALMGISLFTMTLYLLGIHVYCPSKFIETVVRNVWPFPIQ